MGALSHGNRPGGTTELSAQRELAKDRDTYVYFKHEDDPTGALNAASFLAQAGKQ